MKKEQLYEILNEIDETYINNANKSSKKVTTMLFTNSTWLKLGSIAACFCLMILAAVFTLNNMAPKNNEVEFSYIVTYAGWSEESIIYENTLNYELIENDPNTHLPVFKIDTFEELETFTNTYNNVLLFDQGYDTVPSFYEAMSKAQFDNEIFYDEHSLLVVYIPSNSSSLRFEIEGIETSDTLMCIKIERKNEETEIEDNMAGWMVCVKINKDKLSNYISFNAILVEQ